MPACVDEGLVARFLLAACVLGVVAPATRVRAQETTPQETTQSSEPSEPARESDEARERVAVLLLPTGELDPAVADGLAEVLIGAVAARGGVRIIGNEELQAQLGQGDASTLECIGSMACLGRVGVQLAVQEVVAGTLARQGERWVFNVNRVDVRRGEIVGRVFREVDGDLAEVADALSAAVPELYATPVRTATLVIACEASGAEASLDGVLLGTIDGELREEGIAAGQHELRVSAPGHRAWRREVRFTEGAEVHVDARLVPSITESISPLAWIAGGVAVAAFVPALALGVSSQSQLELTSDQRSSMEVTRAELLDYYRAREHEAIAADVLFAIAGVAAIVSTVSFLVPERHVADEETLSLHPSLGGVVLSGRFR